MARYFGVSRLSLSTGIMWPTSACTSISVLNADADADANANAKVLERLRYVKGVALEAPWRLLRALLRRQLFARTQTYESERRAILLWACTSKVCRQPQSIQQCTI